MKLVKCSNVSTCISQLAYDYKNRFLLVEFKGGRRYVYFDVTEWQFRQLRHAPSPGKRLEKSIKPRYAYQRLEGF
jgi:hypothetical protein